MARPIDTVVIGAGQAGLAMSAMLSRHGREHVVLERGRIAERWESQRWDSLRFQSPNWSLSLPGLDYDGDDPDGFASADEVARFVQRHADLVGAPVRTSVAVEALRCRGAGEPFEVATSAGALQAVHVVVATGPYQVPQHPPWSTRLAPCIEQLHASDYRRPGALPPGGVLVVGSGASGCQIADELLEAGRRVLLSVGRHARVPRRHRGRDAFWWRSTLGDLDRRAADTPPEARGPAPLITGVHGGYDVDLRASAGRGLTLLGRVVDGDGHRLRVEDDLERHLRAGDASMRSFIARADAWAERHADVPLEPAAMQPEAEPPPATSPRELDLAAAGVSTVLWATGYAWDFGWIDLPVLDASGAPVHRDGATGVPGLYFLGLPWLHSAKSSFLCGVGHDAERVAGLLERPCGGRITR